jgi:Pvc16 N-terminal domain
VIHDVDESLRALVRRQALNGADVEVAFDAPTKDWAARRNTPTVDLYLYDIREDMRWRDFMWTRLRAQDRRVVEERLPPRRFKLSYLVTAWTQRAEDEHRLLSVLLDCFVRHEVIPTEFLAGTLAADGMPQVFVTIALPPPQDRSLSDVWSALGGELKPSLDLVVTAPIGAVASDQVAPPVLEQPRIQFGDREGEAIEAGRAGRPAAEGGDAAAEAAAAAARAVPEETVTRAGPGQPGRIIRLRGKPRR